MATTLVAPIALQQANQDFYVGRGSLHTIQDAVDAARNIGYPALVIIPQGYGGTDPIASVTEGTGYIYIVDQREGNPFIYQWNGSIYDGPFLDIDGTKLNRDQTVNLNGYTLNFGNGTTSISNLTSPLITADEANFAQCLVDGSPVRTFENTGDPGTGATYPPAGIAVSTGMAWSPNSINPSTLATTAQLAGFLPLAGGTLTGKLVTQAQDVYGQMNLDDAIVLWGGTPSHPLLTLNSAGLYGTVNLNDQLTMWGGTPSAPTASLTASGDFSANSVTAHQISGDNISPGALWTTNIIAPGGQTITIQGVTSFSADMYATNINLGALYAETIQVSGAKNFLITHPADSTKTLTHSVVEGPECALFYRGEGKTKKGTAEITLPDYFEALTRKEGRTVQLTQIMEDGNGMLGKLAASRVTNGKFRVMSENPSEAFYWEVKAVRGDLPPLQVIGKREATTEPVSGKKKSR